MFLFESVPLRLFDEAALRPIVPAVLILTISTFQAVSNDDDDALNAPANRRRAKSSTGPENHNRPADRGATKRRGLVAGILTAVTFQPEIMAYGRSSFNLCWPCRSLPSGRHRANRKRCPGIGSKKPGPADLTAKTLSPAAIWHKRAQYQSDRGLQAARRLMQEIRHEASKPGAIA